MRLTLTRELTRLGVSGSVVGPGSARMSNFQKALLFCTCTLSGTFVAIVLTKLGVHMMIASAIGGVAIGAPIGLLFREK
jgi:hypothetical protein